MSVTYHRLAPLSLGLGLLLAADRLLYRADDQLVLEYNKFNQRWREVRYFSQGA